MLIAYVTNTKSLQLVFLIYAFPSFLDQGICGSWSLRLSRWRARFGHWWLLSLRSVLWALMAPPPEVSVKLHPRLCLLREKLLLEHSKCCLLQGVHQLVRISWRNAGRTCPRHGGDGGCTVSQYTVAVRVGNCGLRCSGTAGTQHVQDPVQMLVLLA